MTMDSRSVRLLVNVSLVLGGLFVALVIGELALRAGKPRQVMIQRQPPIYLRDDALGCRYAPCASGLMHRCFEIDNVVRTNSLGFHDVEHDVAPGALHVAALGDSFTAAFEVPREQGWTALLQQLLREGGWGGTEVVNLGQDHSGTDVHVEILRRYLERNRPDVVLLAFYENDVDDIRRRGFYRETADGRFVIVYADEKQRGVILERIREEAPGRSVTWVCDRLFTARLIRWSFTGEDDLYFNNIVGLKGGQGLRDNEPWRLDRLMGQLLRLSRTHGFRLLLVPVPAKGEPRASVWRLRHELSPERWRELDVVNLFPIAERLLAEDGSTMEQMYWELDGHFNEYGNRVYARVVFEALRERLGARQRRRGALTEE